MVGHLIGLSLFVVIGIVITTGILGRFWRFVFLRPAYRAPQSSPVQRLSLRSPNPDEFEEQRVRRAHLDAPFAAIFLGLSIVVLATPGFDNAWIPTFILWTAAAVVRWIDTGPATAFVRLGTVILLAIEALLVIGIRGSSAFPQAGAYAVIAIIGGIVLYRADALPLSFGPREPGGDLPPRRRPTAPRQTKGSSFGHSLYDTLPATQQRPYAQVTPITQARRNPLRVAEHEGSVSRPYYAGTSMQAGD